MNENREVFEARTITVTWDGARCIHCAECACGLPEAFQPGLKPWVRPEAADTESVAEVVRRCQTGALHYARRDGGPQEAPPKSNAVVPSPHGPYLMRGAIEVAVADREPLRDSRVALCRCGESHNKPFCDGSHWETDFDDGGLLGKGGAPAVDVDAGGWLHVTPTPSGPLLVEGRFRLASARGETCRALERGVLCRCGGSKNKPFCDGAHDRVKRDDDLDVD